MGKSSDFPQSHSPGPRCENPPPRSCTHPCPRLRCPPASVSLYPHSISSAHVPPDTTESVAIAGGACCVPPAGFTPALSGAIRRSRQSGCELPGGFQEIRMRGWQATMRKPLCVGPLCWESGDHAPTMRPRLGPLPFPSLSFPSCRVR